MVLCSVIQEANFLRLFYQNMKSDQVEINIYAEDQSVIELAKNRFIIKDRDILT